jgi:LacI family transcriptional regulator
LELCDVAHPGTMDGLLLAGIAHREVLDRLRDIRRTGLPIVTVHDEPVGPDIPNVGMDQELLGRIATDHLIARGSRAIAHIVNASGRFDGYRQSLAAAGIAYDDSRVYHTPVGRDYSHTTGETAVRHFLDRGVAFDAIFAQSDQEAVGCINMLFQAGRRVPEDVRVIGIDNAPYCDFARVPVSSVSQEFGPRGFKAVEMLMALTNGQPADSLCVAPVLHPRLSSR